MAGLSDREIESYARDLILEHAKDVEYLSIFEVWESERPTMISEPDALRVHNLIQQARVTVTFPNYPGWGD